MVILTVKFLNSDQGVFYSGQVVAGEVELQTNSAIDVNDIKFKVKGNAKTTWHESRKERDYSRGNSNEYRNRRVEFSAEEVYIDTTVMIFGGAVKQELPPGVHKFNFEFPLPINVPANFEHSLGSIRYRVKAILDRPWKMNMEEKVLFNVKNTVDLNVIEPSLLIPQRVSHSKFLCCGLGSPLHLSAELPVSGFISGQTAYMTINVNNETSANVKNMKVKLKQHLKFFGHNARYGTVTRQEVHTISFQNFPGVNGKAKNSFQASLPIPHAPPSNMGTCGVIWVAYEIHITAKLGLFHMSPKLVIPIVIGTVPLALPQHMLSEMEAQNYPLIAFHPPEDYRPPPCFAPPPPQQVGYPEKMNPMNNGYTPYPMNNSPSAPYPMSNGSAPYTSNNEKVPYPPDNGPSAPYPMSSGSVPFAPGDKMAPPSFQDAVSTQQVTMTMNQQAQDLPEKVPPSKGGFGWK